MTRLTNGAHRYKLIYSVCAPELVLLLLYVQDVANQCLFYPFLLGLGQICTRGTLYSRPMTSSSNYYTIHGVLRRSEPVQWIIRNQRDLPGRLLYDGDDDDGTDCGDRKLTKKKNENLHHTRTNIYSVRLASTSPTPIYIYILMRLTYIYEGINGRK